MLNYDSIMPLTEEFPLHEAVISGNIELVCNLIKQGEAVNKLNYSGQTPLHIAALHGNVALIYVLVHAGANFYIEDNNGDAPSGFMLIDVELNNFTEENSFYLTEMTPLHLASKLGQTNVVNDLIKANQEVNAMDSYGYTPLYWALYHHRIETVKALLAVPAIATHPTAGNFLIENNNEYLMLAIQTSDLDLLKLLLANPQVLAAAKKNSDLILQTAKEYHNLSVSSYLESIFSEQLVQKLFQDAQIPQELPKKKIVNAEIALQFAIQNKNEDRAIELIQAGANVHIVGKDKKTFLHMAAKYNQVSTALALIEAGVPVDAVAKGKVTALLDAVKHKDGRLAIALIQAGAKINYAGRSKVTPLHKAAQSNNPLLVKALIKAGANIDAKNSKGETPFSIAIKQGYSETVKTFLRHEIIAHHVRTSAMLAENDNYCLRRAAEKGDLELVNLLLEYPQVMENVTIHDNQILKAARESGQDEVVARLLQISRVWEIEQLASTGLREVARNSENAMRSLTSEQKGILQLIKNHYGPNFKESGETTGVLDNFKNYLVTQIGKSGLSTRYDSTLLSQEVYYKNIFHSAWRLLSEPNPWIAPNAHYVRSIPGGRAANITKEDRENLAYLWLAASDETFPPINGFTHDQIKEHFTQELAYIARAHNYDKSQRIMSGKHVHNDDLQGDKPSCESGIAQRAIQSVMGHPLTEHPSARELTPLIFKDRFKQILVAENLRLPGNLYYDLSKLTAEQLTVLKNAIEKKFMEDDELTQHEQEYLLWLNINDGYLNWFMEDAQEWYGKERLERSITWQFNVYPRYEDFAKKIATEIVNFFADTLIAIIDGLSRKVTESPERKMRM